MKEMVSFWLWLCLHYYYLRFTFRIVHSSPEKSAYLDLRTVLALDSVLHCTKNPIYVSLERGSAVSLPVALRVFLVGTFRGNCAALFPMEIGRQNIIILF
jgi:hypothetical protein